MDHAAAFRHGNLRSGDLDFLVNLYRIAINDFAVQAQRERNSQGAFAGSCGANDGIDAWSAVVLSGGSGGSFVFAGHPREMISRIAITSQMRARSRMPPMIWAREKRIRNRNENSFGRHIFTISKRVLLYSVNPSHVAVFVFLCAGSRDPGVIVVEAGAGDELQF